MGTKKAAPPGGPSFLPEGAAVPRARCCGCCARPKHRPFLPLARNTRVGSGEDPVFRCCARRPGPGTPLPSTATRTVGREIDRPAREPADRRRHVDPSGLNYR
jgi:hypothetical protein